MICAEDELGSWDSHDGIMILSDSKLEPGTLHVQRYLTWKVTKSLKLGLTPNRADAMSHHGVARDLKSGV